MRTDWFVHDRFGIFIHWGLYSMAARHEWVQNFERIGAQAYSKYADFFDPDLFDVDQWMDLVRRAGARYVVLTTKHHEGYCLWDSDLTDFTVTNSPCGCDILAEFTEAARRAGLKVGFYYSLLDWRHPDFTVDGNHPLRGADNIADLNEGRDMGVYREYLHGQVRELLTRYGQIDYLFFDFSYDHLTEIWSGKGAEDWHSEELMALVRELQPEIIVNDRLGIPGDFVTPEEYAPGEEFLSGRDKAAWEACHTLNGSWGYFRDRLEAKSADLVVRMLIDGVAKGGNLLLNVGPTARGEITSRDAATLEAVGEWMRVHGRAIYGAGPAPYTAPPDARYTLRGDRLYLHLFSWPLGEIRLPGLNGRVRYAQLLNDASEIGMILRASTTAPSLTTPAGATEDTLILAIPSVRPNVQVPVIELVLIDE